MNSPVPIPLDSRSSAAFISTMSAYRRRCIERSSVIAQSRCGAPRLVTLPSRARPWLDLEETAAVHPQLLAGDIAGGIGCEEQHRLADVLGLDVGDRHRLDEGKDGF